MITKDCKKFHRKNVINNFVFALIGRIAAHSAKKKMDGNEKNIQTQ